ncbi:hypothetical protein JDN40_12130 [Rhodomicrobium vannielii ATCC 17100]|uniref:hypothetical protein n=1 Tax=Rhodomicrobium vannielii TaxID=1069 RepID=UPI001A2CEE84|nr:hypothetical protein [Rhodomicrobium vannielii]MBJ7534855.1 hypothetical protein [Rhodomicrobium vannielii ATCC 17100]
MGNKAKKYAHCLRTHQAIPFKLRMTDFMARFGMILREVAEWTAYLDKAATGAPVGWPSASTSKIDAVAARAMATSFGK